MQKHKTKQEVIETLDSFYANKELPVEKTREHLSSFIAHAESLINRLDEENGAEKKPAADEGDTGETDKKNPAGGAKEAA